MLPDTGHRVSRERILRRNGCRHKQKLPQWGTHWSVVSFKSQSGWSKYLEHPRASGLGKAEGQPKNMVSTRRSCQAQTLLEPPASFLSLVIWLGPSDGNRWKSRHTGFHVRSGAAQQDSCWFVGTYSGNHDSRQQQVAFGKKLRGPLGYFKGAGHRAILSHPQKPCYSPQHGHSFSTVALFITVWVPEGCYAEGGRLGCYQHTPEYYTPEKRKEPQPSTKAATRTNPRTHCAKKQVTE